MGPKFCRFRPICTHSELDGTEWSIVYWSCSRFSRSVGVLGLSWRLESCRACKTPSHLTWFVNFRTSRINYTQPNTSTPMQIQMTDNSSGSMVAEIHLSPRHVPRISHIYVKGLRVSLDPVEYQVRLVGVLFCTELVFSSKFKDVSSKCLWTNALFHPFTMIRFFFLQRCVDDFYRYTILENIRTDWSNLKICWNIWYRCDSLPWWHFRPRWRSQPKTLRQNWHGRHYLGLSSVFQQARQWIIYFFPKDVSSQGFSGDC